MHASRARRANRCCELGRHNQGNQAFLTNLQFLGGCKTIGRSAYLVENKQGAVLLDYGAAFNGHPTFPALTKPSNLVVALSHAHLDHSGGLPLLFAGGSAPVYMTAITRDLTRVLLEDMQRVSEYFLPFEEQEIERLLRRIKVVEYKEPVELDTGFTLTFYDAGHIPGSAAILVEAGDTSVLYTGDINTIDTQLLRGAEIPVRDADAVILESTYALTRHDPRGEVERSFIETTTEVLDDEGVVLVPAFSVARAQEIACILNHYNLSCPVYLDGLAREASRVFLRHPPFFRDYRLLRNALNKTKWVQSRSQREKVLKEPCVIIAPAGMLKGGIAAMYLSHLMHDSKNAVMLVGYQVEGTPGRDLLEKGTFDGGLGPQKVKARIRFFDFSSHAGQDQLLELGASFTKASHLHTVHGEPKACEYLATTLREQHGIDAVAAETGMRVEL
jgi:putative mRNA 3-end processing factor